ncbi:hypothetical protein ScPMuIL_005934 [Solemya velum]
MSRRRIGIVGFGNIGKFLFEKLKARDDIDIVFVWNRTCSALQGISDAVVLKNLDDFASRSADLIVEVAHPNITKAYGCKFLEEADYFIGSPTALSDEDLEIDLRKAATKHSLYVPAGALWGGEDIKKMADTGSLQGLKVTMTKHTTSFKLQGELKDKNDLVTNTSTVLYEGPVRDLCPLAPNNVNTMAAAAIAAHNLGFDKVQGSIVSDPGLLNWHIVEIDVIGPGDVDEGTAFHCKTVRKNPAQIGHVTGNATYMSFLSSVLAAHGKESGDHYRLLNWHIVEIDVIGPGDVDKGTAFTRTVRKNRVRIGPVTGNVTYWSFKCFR